jgi:hypothetical protein
MRQSAKHGPRPKVQINIRIDRSLLEWLEENLKDEIPSDTLLYRGVRSSAIELLISRERQRREQEQQADQSQG